MPSVTVIENSKGKTMKKLFLLASAVSAVALASSANAQSTSTLILSGTVNPTINITAGTTSVSGVGNVSESGSGAGRTVTLASFATAGITNGNGGTSTFNVISNTGFTASVNSTKGALKNQNDAINFVKYTVAVDGGAALTSDQIITGTAGATAPSAYAAAPVTAKAIPVAYTIPSLIAAPTPGAYTDTLTLTISATN